MALVTQINEDLKTAMKAKDEAGLRALRAIKSALLLAGTESGAGPESLDSGAEIKLLQKLVKTRKESIETYHKANRPELAKTEEDELVVIEKYLPTPPTEAQIIDAIHASIAELGGGGAAQMGKLMPLVQAKLGGGADGKTLATMLKQALEGK